MSPEPNESLEALLDHIRRHRGIDFSNYKSATLKRRIDKRIQALGLDGFGTYLDFLQASPDEFGPLLDALFINVTGFFRDPEAWDTLKAEVLPRVVEEATEEDPLRVWCAGVASGEEAYTMTMLLAEQMGSDAFLARVKIFATDLDEDVLTRARNASYTPGELEDVPPELRQKYFEPTPSGRLNFRADLRRTVIFGRHDLLEDAPISRLRLLVCRNTLMYFNREAQSRVLARFHFALRPDGHLFMGRAEMLLTRRNLFQPLDGKSRIFLKVTDLTFQDRLAVMSQVGGEDEQQTVGGEAQIRAIAFDSSPVAEIVVDGKGNVALVNAAARTMFRLARNDIGRPFHELEVSYKPIELRAPIDVARRERKTTELDDVEWRHPDGQVRHLDVRVIPLQDEGALIAVKVAFQDVTRYQELAAELIASKRDTEVAYEELQSTNEELETTNEELQSTNEELETMNEELQSTNVEIETVNEELRERTEELARLNGYTRSVLDGLSMVVVVLDQELNVRTWNGEAEELWGMSQDEVEGRAFLGLDIGLPVHELKDLIKKTLAGEVKRSEKTLPGHDRKGKNVRHHVTCVPLREEGKANGVILLVDGHERAG